jgi:hypothetical protein
MALPWHRHLLAVAEGAEEQVTFTLTPEGVVAAVAILLVLVVVVALCTCKESG